LSERYGWGNIHQKGCRQRLEINSKARWAADRQDHWVCVMTDVSGDGGLRRSVRRLVLVITLALLGLAASAVVQGSSGVRLRQVASSSLYGKSIAALLTIGLFASVYGISRQELRQNARIVLVAITFGVAFKAVLTGSIMALAYGSAGYLLLGVAVAQIDPLSVAATLQHSSMSRRARSVLSAWASFDDPVTVLLVAYLASFTLSGVRQHGQGVLAGSDDIRQIALNAALVAVAGIVWYLAGVRLRDRGGAGLRNVLLCLVLAGLMAAAVGFDLLIGITVCGLFFRPPIDAVISRVVDLAFYAATFLLGMLLVTGVNVPAGVLLGVSVFLVQVLAGGIISRGMPHDDRVHLALGQQNGLTAIVLALALQPYLPAAVGIIAIAILVVNVLHISCNGVWELVRNLKPQRGRENPELIANRAKPRGLWSVEKEAAGTSVPVERWFQG
jgi:NhaP-type Na+/H+ or K+/H+ antiporter